MTVVSPTPAAELFQTPVRTQYARQQRVWRRRMGAWFHVISKGAAGALSTAERFASLQHVVRAAEERTTFYAGHFAAAGVSWRDLRSPDDLRFLPFLRRRDLQREGVHAFLDASVSEAEVSDGWFGASSGSTGEPVRFFIDAASIHFFAPFVRFLWGRLALGPLPSAGDEGVALLCTLPRSGVYRCWMPLFRWTGFRKLHWEEADAEAYLARANPPVVTGDPHSLETFAERLEAGLAARPRLILSSSFALPEGLRARLGAATGAKVVDYYSMAETGPIAWRCDVDGAFHVLHGAVEVEVDGGELVVTNLRNRLFPLIRWRTGDLGAIEDGACACGFRGRSITRLVGRVAARFVTASGARVDPARVHPLLSMLALRQFQCVQERVDVVRLRIDADRVPTGLELAPVVEAFSRLLGLAVRVEVERVGGALFRLGQKPMPFVSRV